MGVTGFVYLSLFVLGFFSCDSNGVSWNLVSANLCVDRGLVYRVAAGFSAAIDILIHNLPNVWIWNLQMPTIGKVKLAFCFGAGIG
jgi:hypothetical protein